MAYKRFLIASVTPLADGMAHNGMGRSPGAGYDKFGLAKYPPVSLCYNFYRKPWGAIISTA